MTPEDTILCACTRQNLLEEHQEQVRAMLGQNQVRWQLIDQTAEAHGVAPLIYVNLRRCRGAGAEIPQAVLDQLQLRLIQNMANENQGRERLIQVLTYFQSLGIEVMLIKGAALEQLVYQRPYLVVSKDIDLILQVRRTDLPSQTITEIGHQLRQQGIAFDFYSHHDVDMNGTLPVDFSRIWAGRQRLQVGEQEVFVMSPEDMLLAACINSCRQRYFQLKSNYDILTLIEAYPALDWGEFAARAKHDECNYIVYAALLVAQKLLQVNLPAEIWSALQIGERRQATIHRIVDALVGRRSLASLYPVADGLLWKWALDPALLLTYTTFRWPQIGRKIQHVPASWRHAYRATQQVQSSGQ